eukprot:3057805-Amphidinium_carterae.1
MKFVHTTPTDKGVCIAQTQQPLSKLNPGQKPTPPVSLASFVDGGVNVTVFIGQFRNDTVLKCEFGYQ